MSTTLEFHMPRTKTIFVTLKSGQSEYNLPNNSELDNSLILGIVPANLVQDGSSAKYPAAGGWFDVPQYVENYSYLTVKTATGDVLHENLPLSIIAAQVRGSGRTNWLGNDSVSFTNSRLQVAPDYVVDGYVVPLTVIYRKK